MRCNPEDVPSMDAERIGFIFPVYHWTMPEYAIHFVERVQLNPKAYIFVVSTPAMINGGCQDKLAELLQEKHCTLSYGEKVYSVANYVAMYPPFPDPKKRVPKTEVQLASIAQDIVEKKLRNHPHANAITRWLAPRKMQKFIEHCPSNDKYFSVWDDCISFCPKQAINFPKYTRERKKYHNPHVTVTDVVSDRKLYPSTLIGKQ